jgi:hypothetical protein
VIIPSGMTMDDIERILMCVCIDVYIRSVDTVNFTFLLSPPLNKNYNHICILTRTPLYFSVTVVLTDLTILCLRTVLRRIFGPKRDEAIGGWRKLHNEEHHNLYGSPSIIRTVESRRMRWAGDVARMGLRGMHVGFLWESRKERDH